MTVRTTAYTHTEKGGIKNAVGERSASVEAGFTARPATGPGSARHALSHCGEPRTYVIEDYGSALVGRETIDLYMPSRRQMNAWGVRHVEIEILEWGSKAMSLKMLQPRTRNSHVRVMVAQLRKQGISPAG
jgi:3D (Asp-Asp-Asp) domain-containing protein